MKKLLNKLKNNLYLGAQKTSLGVFFDPYNNNDYLKEITPESTFIDYSRPPLLVRILASTLVFIQLISLIGLIISIALPVKAAAKVWDGGGTDNNWSTCANWNLDICPVAADTVTFNSSSTKDSVVDAGFVGTISSITISSGYTGTLSVARTLTVTSTFSQADGTFSGGSLAASVASTFTLSGGTFTSTSNTLSLGGNMTISGSPTFNANGGIITLTGVNPQTLACNGVTFNQFNISKGALNGDLTLTVGSDCNLPLGNNPNIVVNAYTGTSRNGNLILNGTLTGSGTLNYANGGSSTYGVFTINSTANLVGFSGFTSNVGISVVGRTIDFSSFSPFTMSTGSALSVSSAGTLNLPTPSSTIVVNGISSTGASTLTFADGSVTNNGTLTVTGGTFTAPSGTLTILGNISITGNPTFTANSGTFTLGGTNSQVLACNNVAFNQFAISKSSNNGDPTVTVGSDCSLPLGNNPNVVVNPYTGGGRTGSLILNGILTGSGTLNYANGSSTYGVLTINSTGNLVGFSGFTANVGLAVVGRTIDMGNFFPFSINTVDAISVSSAGTLNFPTPSGSIVSGGISSTGSSTLTFIGGNVTNNGALTITGGTFTAPSGILVVGGNIAITSNPTFSANGGTVSLGGPNTQTLTCNNVTFSQFAISKSSNNGDPTVTVGSDCNLPLGNNPSVSVNPYTGGGRTGNLILNGTLTGSGTLNYTNGSSTYGVFTINSTANLLGFSGFTSNVGLSIVGRAVDFSDYTTFNISTVNAITLTTGATLKFPTPTGSIIVTNISVTGGSTFTAAGGNITNNGFLTITGGNFTAPSGTLGVAGNITITGNPTFNANAGMVALIGTGSPVLACNNVVFNQFLISKGILNGDINITVGSDCNLPLGNNPTVIPNPYTGGGRAGNLILNGTLTGSGTLNYVNGTNTTGLLTVNSTGSLNGFNGLNSTAGLSVVGTTLDLSSYTTFNVVTTAGIAVASTGTLKLPTPTGSINVTNISATGGSTFTAAGGNITNNGVLTITGGTFTAPSGTLGVAGSITITGNPTFNANSGTISLIGSGSPILACNNVTFNQFVISKGILNGDINITVGSDCSLPLGNNPTIIVNPYTGGGRAGNLILNGTITGSGTLNYVNGTNTTGTFTANSTAAITGFSGLTSPLHSFTNAGATLDLGSMSSFSFGGTVTVSSGSLKLPDTASMGALTITGGTLQSTTGSINVTNALSLTTGTLNAPTGNLSVGGNLTFTSGTFNHNDGTVNFNGSTATLSCNNVAFNNVTFNNTGVKTVNSNCTLPLGNNPTATNGITLNGTLTGSGTLTETAGTLTLNPTSAITGINGFNLVNLTVAGPTVDTGSYNTFGVSGTVSLTSGSLKVPTGTNITALNVSGGIFNTTTGNINVGSLTISGSPVFNAPTGILTISGALTVSNTPTFNNNSGVVNFTGSAATLSCNNIGFNSVTLNNTGLLTINSNCNFPLGNNPTIANAITLNGTLAGTGTLNMTTGILTLNSGYSLSGFNGAALTSLTLTASSGATNFSSYTSFTATGSVIINAATSLSLPANPIINGDFTVTGASSAATIAAGDMIIGGNLTISTGTFTAPSGDTTIVGNLSITAGTFTASSNTLHLGGNFAHVSGTFTHSNGTLDLNGGNQIISGVATTFYNLTKKVPSTTGQTLTFPANITTTVLNNLVFNGYDNTSRLALRTSSGTTQWKIDPQGSRDLIYIDLKDSWNINATVVEVGGSGSTDSGHNTGYSFGDLVPNNPTNLGPASVISAIYTTTVKPIFTFSLTDPNFLDTIKYNIQIDDNSDFSSPVINYTSALLTQGSKTFTVGQNPGSGTYTSGASGQSLTSGAYYWKINATDDTGLFTSYTFGNSGSIAFYIDSQAPDAFTPTLNVTSPTTNVTPTVTFSTTDNVAVDHYQVKVDSGSFTTQVSPYTLPALTAGTHTITVRAYDVSNNTRDGSVTIAVEVHAPYPFTPTLNVSVPTSNTAPIVSFSTGDDAGISHYDVKIDSGSFTTQVSPYQLPTLAQGNHTVTVRAYNINNVTTDGSITFYVDFTIPNNFTPTLNTGSISTNPTPTITFAATDSQSGMNHYEIQVDSNGFTTRTSPYLFSTPFNEGVHTITVRAFDNAGNYRDVNINFTLDLTAPDAFTPTLNVSSPTSNTRPTVTFTTTDNIGVHHYQIKIDGGTYTTQVSPYQTPQLTQGDHVIYVRAFDTAGNYTDGTQINISIDNSGPVAFTPSLSTGTPTNNTAPQLLFNTSDTNGINRYEIKIDAGSFSAQTSPYQLPTQVAGSHNIVVRAFDNIGNYTDGLLTYIIDITAPKVFSISLNTSATTNNTTPTITFITTDTVLMGHYEVMLDSGDFEVKTSPYTLPVLDAGLHTVKVRAFDAAGNYRDASINITIDTTAPNAFTPTLNVSSPTLNTTPIITFSTTDNVAISYYSIKIDNGASSTRTSPYQIPPLSNGTHTFVVSAHDSAGNITDGVVTLVVSRTSPDPFTPTIDDTNPTNNAAPILSFSTTDSSSGISHYEVKIDNGSFTTQTSPYQLPALSESTYNSTPHTITVRAFNVDGATTDGTLSLKVDLTNPTINPSIGRKYNNTDITTTSFNISDNIGLDTSNVYITGAVPDCRQSSSLYIHCDVTITQSGDVTLTVYDNAGNMSTNTITGYVIETVPPEITITAPTKNSTETITDTTIVVTDNKYILSDNIRAVSGGTIICNQTSTTRIDCAASISDTGNLVINATDNAGNPVAATESGYNIDATPPEAFTPTLNTTPFTSNTAPILFYSTTDIDGIDHYEVQIDSDGFTTQVSPYQLPTLAVGFRTITVRAFDILGNFRDGTVTVTIYDSFPANFTPLLNVSSPTNNTTPQLTFFTTDAKGIDYYEVQIDGGSFITQVSPYLLPELAQGDHTIVVRAFNTVGNYRDGSVNVTVDLTPPEDFIPVVDPGPVTNVDSPDLLYSTTDNVELSHFEVQVDSGNFSIQESPYMVPTIPEGQHRMTVVAFDTAGNTTIGETTTLVDLSAPEISYIAPTKRSNTSITDTTIQIIDDSFVDAADISATGGTINCTQTTVAQVDCTSVVSNSGTLHITAHDIGNNSSTVDIPDYIIDTTVPVITITAPTTTSSLTITDTTIKITDDSAINAADISATGGVIVCLQTSTAEVNCTASISDSGDLVITAIDLADNQYQATQTYTISRGSPAPFVPTLDTPPVTRNITPVVSFETTDLSGINHYEVKVDDGSFSEQTSPYKLSELQEGFHTILVRAYANSGNFRDGSVSVTIDLTNPTSISLNLDITSPTNNPRPVIWFNAQDTNGIDRYEVKVASEGGKFSAQTSPYKVPDNLADGEHTVTVKAFDKAGNQLEASKDFTLDTIPPTGNIIINDNLKETNQKIVYLTIDALDDKSGVDQMMLSENENFEESSYEPFNVKKEFALSNNSGLKIIYVKFKDKAGNESEKKSDSIIYNPLSTDTVTKGEPVSETNSQGGLTFEQIQQTVNDIVKEDLPALLISASIVAIVADIAIYPRFITYGLFLIRFRRKKKTWGVIYNKTTREPIAFASVRIYSAETNEFITQRVTDIEGRYGFVLNRGLYKLEIKQTNYAAYIEIFNYNNQEGIFVKDIGLVPEVKGNKKFTLNIKAKLYLINAILVYAGFTLSIIAIITQQTLLNIIVVILYVIQFIVFRLINKRRREWGYVYNSKTNQRIKGAFVRVYDMNLSRQIEVIITDEQGRYTFNKLKDGEYLVTAYAEGYLFPSIVKPLPNQLKSPTGTVFIKVKVEKGKQINLVLPVDPL